MPINPYYLTVAELKFTNLLTHLNVFIEKKNQTVVIC